MLLCLSEMINIKSSYISGVCYLQLARSVFECVMDNSLTIEPVPEKHPSPG